ncbi:hypothetical protein BXY85_3604 [Roseivirga pacifica]|uniref:Uncharacterized protein n=1 Tax=Roseivirga pacifica TaxID=1267423 RepID=A0A1I0QF57_9BACT|nr:DUF6090 family protein [Roseivirga pacifica]MCO6360772.1 hypothetical protein [Roseivirga pacifica]MCO6368661.1 hypothetical protein [Roseivirga pacifica]MCO6372804.1 hypothetical protein [Roseivirga pacifica]MCO6376863.1 hypothetical protein [Roseivirga pacifica]MCO6377859.1 hypothetical protein [Roseivirga pacifica]
MARKNKKLGQYFAELMVVIVGITIAFALESYSENVKQDEKEAQYLRALQADLANDISELKEHIDTTNQLISLTGDMFKFIYMKAPVDSFSRRHVTATYSTPYFSGNNGTYLSMINSGDLNLLSDFELRQALVKYYTLSYSDLRRADKFVDELVSNSMYPYILKNVAFHPIEDRIEDSTPLKTNEAINLMGSYFNMLANRNEKYDELVDVCKALDKLISSKL